MRIGLYNLEPQIINSAMMKVSMYHKKQGDLVLLYDPNESYDKVYCFSLFSFTPKECFRLQGFLNDEIDLNGLSDTQQYRLAGNGQSVNVVRKIFEEMFK